MKYALTLLALLFLGSVTPAAFAQKPTGEEIGKKAKAAKLDKGNSATAQIKGKRIQFTPVEAAQIGSQADLEKGQVVGVLDTEVEGDETGLPPGKYSVYVAQVDGTWHAYAESGGRIAGEAKRVKVEKHTGGSKKPEIRAEGWCVTACFFVCVEFCW